MPGAVPNNDTVKKHKKLREVASAELKINLKNSDFDTATPTQPPLNYLIIGFIAVI